MPNKLLDLLYRSTCYFSNKKIISNGFEQGGYVGSNKYDKEPCGQVSPPEYYYANDEGELIVSNEPPNKHIDTSISNETNQGLKQIDDSIRNAASKAKNIYLD